MSNEDCEKQALVWLERLREAAAGKQSLVEYCRRHGLRPGEAYQWKRNLRSTGFYTNLTDGPLRHSTDCQHRQSRHLTLRQRPHFLRDHVLRFCRIINVGTERKKRMM